MSIALDTATPLLSNEQRKRARNVGFSLIFLALISAFFFSGRRSVIVTTPSARSTVIDSSSRVSEAMWGDDTDRRGTQPVPEVQGTTGRLRPRRVGAPRVVRPAHLGPRRLIVAAVRQGVTPRRDAR